MTETRPDKTQAIVGPLVAGSCATFVGIGVARFAYAPLLPAMIQAGWLAPGAAGLLGAFNLAGYLAGALMAPRIGRRFGVVRSLRTSMLLAAISMAPCAYQGGVFWFLPWRVLAGLAAGVLMSLTGPTVQSALPVRLRGLAAGMLFAGVGSGSVAGALIVPALLPQGLPATWLALSAAATLLVAVAWRLWPQGVLPSTAPADGALRSFAAVALVVCYALLGIAAAPHMQWWPDYLARGLGKGTSAGAGSWLIWSVAAATAPIFVGRLADWIGGWPALLMAVAAQGVALLLPLLSTSPAALLVSVVLAGATATGISALILTRSRELAGAHAARLWSLCTSSYAASQTAAGFFLAWLYTETGSHLPLFAAGLVTAVLALVLVRR